MAESIDVESMPVEEKYDGPVLHNAKVDIQFMKVSLNCPMQRHNKDHLSKVYDMGNETPM